MTVVIRDVLCNPPSWPTSIRDLTLIITISMKLDIVVESPVPDLYVKWLRPRGIMDFIQDIVSPGSERGIRIDNCCRFPRITTILVDRIIPENTMKILGNLGGLRNING